MTRTAAAVAPTATDDLVHRHFTTEGENPLDAIEWETRDSWPDQPQYHRPNLEVPKSWGQQALDIASKLYLAQGKTYSEDSIRTLVLRVARKITNEGVERGYFGKLPGDGSIPDSAQVFEDELVHILINQLAAFNSPVWFNIGRPDRKQQVSACFILSVDDDTGSISETADREINIFRGGSGSGFNVSRLRGSAEGLSGGGTASGPVSFMRLWDAGAGTFKSGGTTRRAAKLVACDADHPDIRDFIECKVREEDRIRLLLAAGLNLSMDEEGERNLAEMTSFQNANNSVGVTDDFMIKAVGSDMADHFDDSWPLIARRKGFFPGDVVKIDSASELLDLIADAAWHCADPGLQYQTTMNDWHTTPRQGPIRSSNPCGEYLSNDDTSCNLASINLLKFIGDPADGARFSIEDYRQVVDVMTLAMDILVDFADFPDEIIGERSRALRQLGLGYSNMGAAIMAQGLPYDSDQARDFAAAATALLTGRAYRKSAQVAREIGPFKHFAENRGPMLGVIDKHVAALPDRRLNASQHPDDIWVAAAKDWIDARGLGTEHGYRNAQASVIAPAGTISYFMGCDTTGIEPAFTLVTFKDLAGGGSMKLVNGSTARAAAMLGGYSDDNLKQLADGDTSCISPEDLPVFASAGEIAPEGHVRMLAAVQPFVSGGISKTINMPHDATREDIKAVYVLAWRTGCKDLAVYRDGSKARQVLMSAPKAESTAEVEVISMDEAELPKAATPHAEDAYEGVVGPERRRMPRDANMRRHKFNVGGHEGYLMCGEFEDGTLGEIFIEDVGKEGSHVRGMVNAWCIAISIGLQYGVPLEMLARKYSHMNFEPNGPTENPEIPTARSIVDYIFRYLARHYLGTDVHEELQILTEEVKRNRVARLEIGDALAAAVSYDEDGKLHLDHESLQRDIADQLGVVAAANGNGRRSVMAPVELERTCSECGGIMNQTGGCYTCTSCGNNTGCG